MRLHRLQLTAFGPFAETVDVDFDAAGANGLFLVHGPTGAGKTSLLDAICFALYAGVPGARPSGRALRSDHARRDVVPIVRLEFGVGSRRFRVTRSPEYSRPKKRGLGETKSPASVVLEEHRGGRWVGVSTRADEVGDLITEVLGMGLDQFSKVVLLPQGDFAAFLRATADERRAVLEKLFDISTYAGVEAWLVDRRRGLSAGMAAAEAALATDLARLADVLAEAPAPLLRSAATAPEAADTQDVDSVLGNEQVDWPAVDPASLPRLLDQVQARLDQHAVAALAASGDAESRAAAAQAAAVRAAALADRQRRGAEADRVLKQGAIESTRWLRLRETVDRAERAEAVSGDVRAVKRARARFAAAERRVQAARSVLGHTETTDWSVDAGMALVKAMDRCGSVLEEAASTARRLAPDEARLEQVRAGVERDRSALRTARDRLDGAARRVQVAEAAVEARSQLLQRLDRLRQVVDQQRRLHRLSTEVDVARNDMTTATGRVQQARDEEQQARQEFLALQQARLDGMAGELARQLEDGCPCVVCGSTAHPAPARSVVAVSSAAVAASETRWQALRADTSKTEEVLAAVQQLLATRTRDLEESLLEGDWVGEIREQRPATAELASALTATAAEVDQATQELTPLAQADANLEAARSEVEQATADAERRSRLVASSQAAVSEVEGRLSSEIWRMRRLVDDHRDRCPCAGQSPVDAETPLNTVVDHHARVRAAAVEVAAALTEVAEVSAELAAVERSAQEMLQRNGFRSVEQAIEAALEQDGLGDLRREVREVDDRRAAAEATLQAEEVVQAMQEPTADPGLADLAAERARSELRRAQHEQTATEAAVRTFGQVRASIVERVGMLQPLTVEAAQVAELADTATGIGGQNTLRMRLTAFVLAARLEKVAALANERLRVMGDGRYRLAHSDGLATGGRRSGLGLVVLDEWTGQARDTASLSGGESFMASLALALGLADAVREETGGFDLHTLFIDEGFGTLDEESLEQVMSVLDGLRDGGRCVGVVSHVSDLRSRIPAQVRVDKTATGSSVTVLAVESSVA